MLWISSLSKVLLLQIYFEFVLSLLVNPPSLLAIAIEGLIEATKLVCRSNEIPSFAFLSL